MFNRIVFSLVIIAGAAVVCDYYGRPSQSAAFRAAVLDYSRHDYSASLRDLRRASVFEPDDPAVLALMGWDLLRMKEPRRAEACFRQSHWLEPNDPNPLLGYVYTEISLEHYARAERLLEELGRRNGKSAAFLQAASVLARELRSERRSDPRPSRAARGSSETTPGAAAP